LFVQPLS